VTRPHRRAVVAIVSLLCSSLIATTACSSPVDDFCHQLDATYDLTDLRAALDRDDATAIQRALEELQKLTDLAPSEIHDDVQSVVDAVVGSVRAVVPVKGPNGENMPVDLTKLNAALDAVAAPSLRVQAYRLRHCVSGTSAP
jgi:hypothetical protein